jgi:hypothetical protein
VEEGLRKNLLFVNKKKQKNFIHWLPSLPGKPGANGEKFFGSFFQKRTAFFRWCRVQDLNPRPSVYKTAALPLC